jgi:hypothetical protein
MIIEQPCPLCDNAAATYKTTDKPFGKSFECPSCTKFYIDSSSEIYLSSLSEVTKTEHRIKLSKMAKACLIDNVFELREPRSDELGGDGHGVARTTMIAEYRKRDRL